MRILFAVAEAYPFAKVGGLADVGGALPAALAARGLDVRLVLPGYPWIGRGDKVRSDRVTLGDAEETVHLHRHGTHLGVDLYTIQNGSHFDRDAVYGYEDDVARFILYSKAVVAFAADRDWAPDVIHTHDWHLGPVPQLVSRGRGGAALSRTGTVFTIHNLAYQGDLPKGGASLIDRADRSSANLLARGIASADEVNTVSRRYLEEILTPEHGRGMDELLRSRRERLSGILNGVDYSEFNPATDPHIPARYDPSSLERKTLNKTALQRRSGLRLDPRAPLLAVVARLVDQKGLHLVCAGIDRMVEAGAQVVVAGLGDQRYHRALEEAARRHRGAVSFHPSSDEGLARLLYAGSDVFLAPSMFEPCGLGPLIALRYGSIPVVRRTGGLAETILDYTKHPAEGLGFTFVAKYPQHLLRCIRRALDVYRQPERWGLLQRRAMAADFSWQRPSEEYERLYRRARATRATIASRRVASAPGTE